MSFVSVCNVDRTEIMLFSQVLESMDRSYLAAPQPEKNLQQISSQFHDALRLNALEHNSESKVCLSLCLFGLCRLVGLDQRISVF